MADRGAGENAARLARPTAPVAGRVCSGLFFFPRGGSAQVARALTGAASFFSGIEVSAVDYSPSPRVADPLAGPVPFQPSYEDRPAGGAYGG
jgi:hypothetical protein